MCIRDRYYFRHIADEICLEHKLSIVEKPELHRSPAYLPMKDKAGMPTRYNNAKKAIDVNKRQRLRG